MAEIHDMACVANCLQDALGLSEDFLWWAVAKDCRVEVALQANLGVSCVSEDLLCLGKVNRVIDANDVRA